MRLLILALLACTLHAAEPVSDMRSQMEAVEKRAAELREQAKKLTDDFYSDWLRKADLSPAPIPKLGPDPRESERKRKGDIEHLNNMLIQMNAQRKKNDIGGMVDMTLGLMNEKDLWPLYWETRK